MTKSLKKDFPQTADRLAYHFAFGGDENLYTVSFKGTLKESEIRRMLAAVRPHLYRDCETVINSYLDCHRLLYSDFMSKTTVLSHRGVMAFAKTLLHTGSCTSIERWTEHADLYYVVLDHQKWIQNGCCEGCCCAIAKTPARRSLGSAYHMIGQTFQYQPLSCMEQAYFAIRSGKGSRQLSNIETQTGDPVLPTFGSADLISLLLNIQTIRTASQAAEAALNHCWLP